MSSNTEYVWVRRAEIEELRRIARKVDGIRFSDSSGTQRHTPTSLMLHAFGGAAAAGGGVPVQITCTDTTTTTT